MNVSPTEPFPVFDDEDDTTITTNFVGSPPIPRNRARRNAMASSTPLELPIAGANRGQSASASQASSIAGNSYTNGATNNGSGGAGNNYASPLPAGHQQDLNYLYDQIQELSWLLQANRAKTAELTRVAERAELQNRTTNANGNENGAHDDGAAGEEGDASVQSDKARIRQLERELSNAQTVIAAYKHEQTENTSLIAMYEDAMGNTTELVRNYANAVEGRFLEQRRVYNNLLQAEKDEHLASRMEKDHWFAKYMEVREMIRTANRLRTDEWCEEYAVVAGLQGQVRCLRRVLGFEAEKPEEEVGWPYLKDLPFDDTDPNP